MSYSQLFEPLRVGDLNLRNRILMAPMTRSRATDDDRVTALQARYYQQRASAGLIISEGVHPSIDGKGYNRTPGIYNADQVTDWATVTKAVHEEGGLIACQLMHCGRVGHAFNKAPGSRFLAPSAIAANAEIFTPKGMQSMPVPEVMSIADIDTVVTQYGDAASRCLEAGFDAVELHCASGYLPAQFLATGSNTREDDYGGSLDNRLRFVERVLDSLVSAIGAGRVGLRIAPGNPYNDHHDDNPTETFSALLQRASARHLAWVHAIRIPAAGIDNLALARQHFSGVVIGNESFDAAEADAAIGSGAVDAVAFGRYFIANPDLPARFAQDADLNALDKRSIYAGEGEPGYTDYPFLSDPEVSATP